ncbi:PREDICTED: uncharacterized protein LOC109148758 [Ipomoea nil]|uniref:uncharacterized protein LOC109148758 n=1 Tax=Ipomoea nil TaxID=35883 RepID=UPI000901CEEA|nr:PREDICTED: uncharacterized protein LOC109148758 [Ipomoea nil]
MPSGSLFKFTQCLWLSEISFLRSEMEDGSSWIAVLSQYSSSKHSISPNSSGNFSNLEQPERTTAFRPFNLQMLLGRFARCLQLLTSINLRFVRRSIDDGSSWIAVLSQYNSSKHSISPNSSGNFSNLEQPERITAFRPFNLQMLLGRLARCLQFLTFINLRFVRYSIDDGTSLIAVAPACTSNKQSMGAAIFGKFSSFKQPERVILSSFSK